MYSEGKLLMNEGEVVLLHGHCEAGRNEYGRESDLAQEFEGQRPRLLRVAYAITGSFAEAEDCVQEAWLRLQRIEDPASTARLTQCANSHLVPDSTSSAAVLASPHPTTSRKDWSAPSRMPLNEGISGISSPYSIPMSSGEATAAARWSRSARSDGAPPRWRAARSPPSTSSAIPKNSPPYDFEVFVTTTF